MEMREILIEELKDDDATVGELLYIKKFLDLTEEEFCELMMFPNKVEM